MFFSVHNSKTFMVQCIYRLYAVNKKAQKQNNPCFHGIVENFIILSHIFEECPIGFVKGDVAM